MKRAINIRLDDDLISSLDYAAKEMNLTRTTLIERAIIAYQDKMDEMVSDRIIDKIRNGETSTISLKQFFEETGLNNV